MSHENSTSPILSFNDAYKSCQDNCANLVSIHSRRELSYIQGIYSPFNISSVTIGGLSTAPMAPYWSDLSHWDFAHINPRTGTTGNCFQMAVKTDLTWSKSDCAATQYFLCKRPTGITCGPPTPAPPVIITPAPTNPSGCNSTALFDAGTITSPNYPSTFPIPSYCVYKLTTLGAYRIGIYFSDLSMSQNSYVLVYDSNGSLIVSLTRSSSLGNYYSSSNTMTVSFTSGNYNGYRGFSAKFLSF